MGRKPTPLMDEFVEALGRGERRVTIWWQVKKLRRAMRRAKL